ncbi:hypothetical protein QM806_39955 [Rhodococcus sp. IEGM 1351]|uniref:hypothetical protein n=1 Tax=Rhodococcus sp. IEGM 1351 TaxID=3047089 RepID=UPI0024B7E7D1|nr:hypothetical protein [Rhodococcus sp. IEGM 1351]MDI9941521.1 hypothetical protein [Rhodococcus sp. IEGM 1351]
MVDGFVFEDEPARLELLNQACRALDIIAVNEKAMEDQPLTVTGSMGQMVIHPLTGENRAQRGLFKELVGAMKLPEAELIVKLKEDARTDAAKKAATVRWDRGTNVIPIQGA